MRVSHATKKCQKKSVKKQLFTPENHTMLLCGQERGQL